MDMMDDSIYAYVYVYDFMMGDYDDVIMFMMQLICVMQDVMHVL